MKHFSLPKDGGLIEAGLPKDILHSYETIPTEIYDTAENACRKTTEMYSVWGSAQERLLSLCTGSLSTGIKKERYHLPELRFSA